jgi:hypothetical protein
MMRPSRGLDDLLNLFIRLVRLCEALFICLLKHVPIRRSKIKSKIGYHVIGIRKSFSSPLRGSVYLFIKTCTRLTIENRISCNRHSEIQEA